MIISKNSTEEDFFNNISGEYNVLTQADYDVFLRAIESVILQYSDNLQILEACCGTGIFGRKILAHFKSQQITITGVDISSNLINYLSSLKIKNYIPLHGDILSKTLFETGAFDVILCPFALHHLLRNELKIFIENAFAWLKPEGILIAIEPNGTNPVLWASNRIGKIYRGVFRNTKYLSPHETVYSCGFYNRQFFSSDFKKIIEKKFKIEGNISKMNFGIQILVLIKNNLSKIFGDNVALLIYGKKSNNKL